MGEWEQALILVLRLTGCAGLSIMWMEDHAANGKRRIA